MHNSNLPIGRKQGRHNPNLFKVSTSYNVHVFSCSLSGLCNKKHYNSSLNSHFQWSLSLRIKQTVFGTGPLRPIYIKNLCSDRPASLKKQAETVDLNCYRLRKQTMHWPSLNHKTINSKLLSTFPCISHTD